jgi:hypothetical protein
MANFDNFWNMYPRKVGRLTAKRSWEKISLEKDLEYSSKELNSCLSLIQVEKDKFEYQIEDFISFTSDNTNHENSSISSLDRISKDLENLKIEEENLLNTKNKLISEIELENKKLNKLKIKMMN